MWRVSKHIRLYAIADLWPPYVVVAFFVPDAAMCILIRLHNMPSCHKAQFCAVCLHVTEQFGLFTVICLVSN